MGGTHGIYQNWGEQARASSTAHRKLALLWLFYVASRRTFFARNMTHALPLFVVLACVGFDLLRERTESMKCGGLVAAVALLALAMPAWQSVSFALLLREPDTRILAAERRTERRSRHAGLDVVL